MANLQGAVKAIFEGGCSWWDATASVLSFFVDVAKHVGCTLNEWEAKDWRNTKYLRRPGPVVGYR